MLRLERTFDYALVRAIMTHPRIYAHMVSDGAAPREAFRPIESDWLWYVLVWDDAELLGLFLCVPYTSVCWEIHTCLLPQAWGERARRAYQAGLAWLRRETPCRKVIGNIPSDNPLALRLALRAGCEVIGTNRASLARDGRLIDQTIVGQSI